MPAFQRDGHPGPWIDMIRKRGDCPREQAAGHGGGNRRQDGNDEARQLVFASARTSANPTHC